MIHRDLITLQTRGHRHMHDITEQVAGIVRDSGMMIGTVHIFNVGSTATIGTIEFEPGLEHDLPELLDRLMPPSREYGHEKAWHDGNGHSHLQATTMGPEITVPFEAGALVLGTSVPALSGRGLGGSCLDMNPTHPPAS